MDYIANGLKEALRIIFSFEREFLSIVAVSIKVSFSSTLLAAITGVPFGIFIAQKKFPGRDCVFTLLNTLMSLPTVVVGLMVYSFLSRRGPLGELGLLYTLSAMIIGQFILIFPIISGLTVTAVRSLDKRIKTTVISLGADSVQGFWMFLREARLGIAAAIIAGFGRVFAEVGVSMMLGGNIKAYTRNITTAIALETSKGEFALGIALGIVLLTVAFTINFFLTKLQKRLK
ncbi:MAG: ABC transporter permease [Candidatus Omnitrophica bacterium]|nr:ABC transporter permease [Candidatus Omnitrophota bacterium]